MNFLIIQSALLMMIAYTMGCVFGCLLHRWFSLPMDGPLEEVESQPEAVAAPVVSKPVVSEPVVEEEPVAVVEDEPKKEKKKSKKKNKKKEKTKKKAKAKAKKTVEDKPKTKSGAGAKTDDLKLIRGIGIQNEAKLNALKITSFSQIAEWKAADIKEIGDRLEFGGRIKGEKWVSQAKRLAAGKDTEFSKRVRKGEVRTSQSQGKQ